MLLKQRDIVAEIDRIRDPVRRIAEERFCFLQRRRDDVEEWRQRHDDRDREHESGERSRGRRRLQSEARTPGLHHVRSRKSQVCKRRQRENDDDKHEGQRRAEARIGEGEEAAVDVPGNGRGRVDRAAVGQNEHGIEQLQVDDRGENDREIKGRFHQRQSEAEKAADRSCAVQLGGVIEVLGQRKQSRKEEYRPESETLPDLDHRDGWHGEMRDRRGS